MVGAVEQYDVEYGYEESSKDAKLLDDDSIDKVGISLREEVTLYGVSWSLSHDIRRCYRHVGIAFLPILVEVIFA